MKKRTFIKTLLVCLVAIFAFTLTGCLEDSYRVTVVSGEGYTVSGITKQFYQKGEEVTFSVTVTDETKKLVEVVSDQVTISEVEENFHFVVPSTDVTIEVVLKDRGPKHLVTVKEGEGFIVSPFDEEGYEEDTLIRFTVTVTDETKAFGGVTIEGVEIYQEGMEYIFTMPAKEVIIEVKLVDLYQVEFYCGNFKGLPGENPETQVVRDGDKITLPANPWTYEGKTFKGWKIEHMVDEVWETIDGEVDKAPGYEFVVTENIRVTATWTDVTIVIEYDANGGSGEMASSTTTWTTNLTISTNTFVAPTGKVFGGWAVEKDGEILEVFTLSGKDRVKLADVKESIKTLEDGTFSLTLYAIWIVQVQVSDIEGVWTAGEKTVIITTENIVDDDTAKGSIIINNECMTLYSYSDDCDFFALAKDYETYYMISYVDNKLVINEDVYTTKQPLQNASKADFVGNWKRDNTTQVWEITEEKATLNMNNSQYTANAFIVVDKYLVIEYELSYIFYQFVLTKEENKLVGYYIEDEKTPVATSFTKEDAQGGSDEELPSGVLYNAEVKAEYSSLTNRNFSFDKIVFDEEGKKLYVWGTINGKAVEAEVLELEEYRYADYYEGPDKELMTKCWEFYISGIDFYFAVLSDGRIIFCDNQDAQIGENVYRKAE